MAISQHPGCVLIPATIRMASPSELDAEINKGEWSHTPIPDSCAKLIASWWQSPGFLGRVLAGLASGYPTPISDIFRACDTEIANMPGRDRCTAEFLSNCDQLDALKAWANLQ